MANGTPYSVDIPPDVARQMAEKFATLLLLDVPQGTRLGLDHLAFAAGPKFQGLKMVLPGLHYLHYSPGGGDLGANFAPTTSRFMHLSPRQVVVMRWNPRLELLLDVDDEAEAARYEAGVRAFAFDAGLAPYNLHGAAAWRELTDALSPEQVARLSPLPPGNICVLAEADAAQEGPKTAAEAKMYSHLEEGRERLQGMLPSSNAAGADTEGHEGGTDASTSSAADRAAAQRQLIGRCYYTRLPRLVKRQGLSPAELTALNMDKSMLLEEVVAREYKGRAEDIVGELQFAYLAFLLGQSLEGFGQWKAIIHLMLGCEGALLGPRSHLFSRFVRALTAQLRHGLATPGGSQGSEVPALSSLELPQELFGDSFMQPLLRRFCAAVDEAGPAADPQLSAAVRELRALLEGALGWQLSVEALGEEDDEDGPVVVEL